MTIEEVEKTREEVKKRLRYYKCPMCGKKCVDKPSLNTHKLLCDQKEEILEYDA